MSCRRLEKTVQRAFVARAVIHRRDKVAGSRRSEGPTRDAWIPTSLDAGRNIYGGQVSPRAPILFLPRKAKTMNCLGRRTSGVHFYTRRTITTPCCYSTWEVPVHERISHVHECHLHCTSYPGAYLTKANGALSPERSLGGEVNFWSD